MYLIVGLGNPGDKYLKTYHNLGYMSIDILADKLGVEFTKTKFNANLAQAKYKGETLLLTKPLTFMNLSGESVVKYVQEYKLKPNQVIVLCDDIDLEPGVTRYREHGSAGTHNGLRNILAHIGEGFRRVKIGAGVDRSVDLATFVLSPISQEKMQVISPALEQAADKVLGVIDNDINQK